MMRSKLKTLAFLLAAGVLLSPGFPGYASEGGAEWGRGNLVIALKPDKDPDKLLREREALSDFFAERMGGRVEVVVPLSAAVISEGLRNGTVDVAYISATEMVPVADGGVGSVLLVNEIAGVPHYESYWVVAQDSPYESIEDLQGRPVAFSSRTSTSGYLIPLVDLRKRGLVESARDLEDFFGRGNVLFGTGYVSAVERVLSGDAAAAAVSDYVFDEDRHLTEEQKARLRKLQSQGPVPTHLLAVSERLSPEEKEMLEQWFLEMNAEDHTELRDKVFTSKLIERDQDTHLEPVREALSLTGAIP